MWKLKLGNILKDSHSGRESWYKARAISLCSHLPIRMIDPGTTEQGNIYIFFKSNLPRWLKNMWRITRPVGTCQSTYPVVQNYGYCLLENIIVSKAQSLFHSPKIGSFELSYKILSWLSITECLLRKCNLKSSFPQVYSLKSWSWTILPR